MAFNFNFEDLPPPVPLLVSAAETPAAESSQLFHWNGRTIEHYSERSNELYSGPTKIIQTNQGFIVKLGSNKGEEFDLQEILRAGEVKVHQATAKFRKGNLIKVIFKGNKAALQTSPKVLDFIAKLQEIAPITKKNIKYKDIFG